MVRRLALLALLIPIAAAAQPPGVEEPDDPEALADLVGTWVAVDRNQRITLGVMLTIENGALAGELMDSEMGGPPFTAARLVGDRVTLTIEAEEDEAPGQLVLRRTARGLQVVRARIPYQRVRGGTTLLRRDALWSAMRMEMRDLLHDAGDHDLGRLLEATEAVRKGVRAAGRASILDDLDQAMCLIALTNTEASFDRIQARAHALAQAAGRRSICDVDQDTMSPGEAGPTASGCARVTINDSDGRTTLRERPSSRGEARGTVPNGTKRRVDIRRGSWLFLGYHRAWVHASNVTCEP